MVVEMRFFEPAGVVYPVEGMIVEFVFRSAGVLVAALGGDYEVAGGELSVVGADGEGEVHGVAYGEERVGDLCRALAASFCHEP